MRATKTHALTDVDDARIRPKRTGGKSYELCKSHPGRLLDLYCQDHRRPVCSTCVIRSHRVCETVSAIGSIQYKYPKLSPIQSRETTEGQTKPVFGYIEKRHERTQPRSSYGTCENHNEQMDLYCQDHNFAVCSTCVIQDHRSCETVVAIDKEGNIKYNHEKKSQNVQQTRSMQNDNTVKEPIEAKRANQTTITDNAKAKIRSSTRLDKSAEMCLDHEQPLEYYCQDHHHLVCVECVNERKHIACEINRATDLSETSVTSVKTDFLSLPGHAKEENKHLEKEDRKSKPESNRTDTTRQEKADMTVVERSQSGPNQHQDKSTLHVVPHQKSRPKTHQAFITSGPESQLTVATHKQPIFDEIARFKMSLVEHLDKLEDGLKKEMDVLCNNCEDMMQRKIDSTRSLRDDIQNALNIASSADPEDIAPISMRDQCDEFERMTKEERSEYKDVELKFMPEENVSALVTMVIRLGRVNVIKKQNESNVSKPFIHRSAHISGLLNGKRDGDKKDCIFNSVDMGSSGDIIVADFNNCSVKLFDHAGMFLSQAKLSSVPRGVCFLEQKIAAIALPKEGIIKLMSIDGNFLTHLKDLHTSFKAYRMCSYRSKLLGICYSKATRSVSVVEQSGKIGKTITKKKDKTGHGGVAYDPAKNLTYMSDREQICCYGEKGNEIFRNTFRRADLRGMTLDCQGNLYVCSHETKSVLQISSNGTLVKSISVPIPPQDVAIQPMGNKMVVVGLGNVAYVYILN